MNPTSLGLIILLLFPEIGVHAQNDGCTGHIPWIGDGWCDHLNNNAECGYDGGDCCYCSCVDSPDYSCGQSGFDCRDPEYVGAEVSDCNEQLLVDAPCPSDTAIEWNVNDTLSASALTDAVLCSGGVFNVQWLGQVIVNQTIKVANGTVLRVAGVGSGAKMQAGSSNRLFTVINASLDISNIEVADGRANFGGAIASTRSYLSFVNSSFTGNSALIGGGALHGTLGSVAFKGKGVLFDGNHAGVYGGALSVEGASSVVFHGYASYTNNIAHGHGGALFFSSSNIAWAGYAFFSNNTAHGNGGALCGVFSNMSWGDDVFFFDNTAYGRGGGAFINSLNASWAHHAFFSNNIADLHGGALDVSSSEVIWAGDALFHNNKAGQNGGALLVMNSNIFWAGDALFSDNTADGYGGALYIHSSEVFWAEGASFSHNNAEENGGALAVFNRSTVSWIGDTLIFSNTAREDGGALYAIYSHLSWAGDVFLSNNTADEWGGALSLWDSTVSWGSYALFTDNIANEQGGALFILGSDVSWRRNVSFSFNTAHDKGGALFVSDSNVSWADEASFSNNAARTVGGALCLSSSNAFWEGDVSFSKNSAEMGGALFASNSDIFWESVASFCNNNATMCGGALLLLDSNISWAGDALFLHNTAEHDGGALYIDSNISSLLVSWAGDALFSGNTAKKSGGALYVTSNISSTDVSWAGNAAFFNNTANDTGGALYVYSSSLSWAGDVVFHGNTAYDWGGALIVFASNLSWAGDVIFSKNTADGWGGALYVSSSDVSWEGDTSFSDNIAKSNGGALAVYDSPAIFWRARAFFLDNVSGDNGGALFVLHGSGITLELGAVFLRNTASGDGGAVFIYGSDDNKQASSFFVNSTTIFLKNVCGGDGGALTVVDAGSVKAPPTNVTFSRNSANTAGGAVAVKGSGVGPQFTGLTFRSNDAQIGGAAYITSSGTATTEDQLGAPVEHPTTFERCKFIGNRASGTGGAIESRAGLDVITDTYFAGNTATAGGALRLAGISSLHNCTFTENTSDNDEGPSVSNVGFVESMNRCSFLENAFNCEAGEFLDYHPANTSNVVFDVVCEGCDVECDECTTSRWVPVCSEELENTKSPGGNTTIEALQIDPGYWRTSKTSRNVLKCYNADACLGGVTGASNYCGAGYEGPYCSICREGYSPGVGRICSKCSGGIGPVVVTAIVASSLLLVVALVLSFLVCGMSNGAARGLLASWRSRLLSLKIIVIVWQVLTQFSSVANVMYPGVYQKFLDGINILNFDLSWILSAECVLDLNFHHRLLVSTLGPPVALAFLGAIYALYRRRSRAPFADFLVVSQEEVSNRYLPMVLLLSFLVYSSVSSTLFQMFAFDELDDGKSYLRADHRIDYNSSTHRSLQVYAACMMAVYTVGIPVLYGTLLFRNRLVLMDERARQEDAAAKSISSLWELYEPDRFYYDLIECARRILLAGVVVFIFPNSVAQVAIALMITLFFMVLSETLAPYKSLWDTWINRIGHAIVFSSIYLALLLKIDISDERKDSERLFESILISGHVFMFLLVTVEGTVIIYKWVKRSS